MNSKKQKILAHCEDTLDQISNVQHLSEDQWRMPISKGKWTIAEVIGHFIPWDKYFIERIPYLINEKENPPSPSIEAVNEKAANISRNRRKEETIKEVIDVRKMLISKISDLQDELWEKEFNIGNNTLSLYSDLSRLVKHDQHHFTQLKQRLSGREN